MSPGEFIAKWRASELKERSAAQEHFILYALPEFPNSQPIAGETGIERTRKIQDNMSEKFNNPKFIPYIQVHEFEALIFVDLDLLETQFPDGEAKGAADLLRADVGGLNPEDIDDGVYTAPSKRLIHYRSGNRSGNQ